MKRIVLCALVLLACTKARPNDSPSAGSAPAAPAAPAAPDSAQVPSTTPAAPATTPAPPQNVDDRGGVGAEAIRGTDVVASKERPGDALNKQVKDLGSGSGTPAKGGRSLVVVKSKTALEASTLDAGKMAFEYVSRGRAAVKRCFEDLRAKDPSATGVLTLRFAVDVKGAVVDAHVDGFNREVASCVQSAMSTWTFSAPDKQTRFELVLDLVIG